MCYKTRDTKINVSFIIAIYAPCIDGDFCKQHIQKVLFLKISISLYLPYSPLIKDQGETKEEPRNDLRTPNHQKVLFIKIGYLKEIFITVTSTVCLPCQMPLSISFTPLCKVSLHSRTSAKMSHR